MRDAARGCHGRGSTWIDRDERQALGHAPAKVRLRRQTFQVRQSELHRRDGRIGGAFELHALTLRLEIPVLLQNDPAEPSEDGSGHGGDGQKDH